MKYTQYAHKKKGNSAFYITIALCLVILGVIAFIAFNNIDTDDQKMPKNSSTPFTSSEYNSSNSSYINSESEIPSNPTDNEVKNEEYKTESKAKAKKVKAYSLPVNGEILKDFSLKALQYSATFNDMRIHPAVDIACAEGTLVSAAADGKVQSVEDTADLGKVVTIDHGDGLIIKYCSLKNVTVKKDTAVKMGDSIGAVGTVPCECSDQSHLHIEAFKNGKSISILKFFE